MIANERQLEDLLSQPSAADVAAMRRLEGTLLILGAGGKMGPSLARRARRAADEAQSKLRIVAVSRFGDVDLVRELERDGIETHPADLLDRAALDSLPDAKNVIFMA